MKLATIAIVALATYGWLELLWYLGPLRWLHDWLKRRSASA